MKRSKNLQDKININSKDQYWIHYLRGYSHLKLSEYDDAIFYFRKALEINQKVLFVIYKSAFHFIIKKILKMLKLIIIMLYFLKKGMLRQ